MAQIKERNLRLREIVFSVSSSSFVLVLVLAARFRIEDEHEGRGRFSKAIRRLISWRRS